MPEKYKSLTDLIESFHGKDAFISSKRKTEEGDIIIAWGLTDCGIKEREGMKAHYCPVCIGFYQGPAPLNEKGQRYCESCNILL